MAGNHFLHVMRKYRVRTLALLDALARAGITPVPLRVVHELAYLSNVLAPVFELDPFAGSVLKRRGGPYYPELQRALDAFVGRSMILVSDARYVFVPEESRYRFDAHYRLNRELSSEAVIRYRVLYADTGEIIFLDELAAAYNTLSTGQLGNAAQQDARYADEDVDSGGVIDFGEWAVAARVNFSRNAALSFAPGANLLPAERLYLYMDHLKRRASVDG